MSLCSRVADGEGAYSRHDFCLSTAGNQMERPVRLAGPSLAMPFWLLENINKSLLCFPHLRSETEL